MNSINLQALHQRYLDQAEWTRALRERWLQEAHARDAARILEVGSGTGVIIDDASISIPGVSVGVDIDHEVTAFAAVQESSAEFTVGDGISLPFPADTFDIVLCHFLLLWTQDPMHVLSEMYRTLCRDGWMMAFAEPDHKARLDYPDELIELGELQTRAIQRLGANIELGRKLGAMFQKTGLAEVEVGIYAGEWNITTLLEASDAEWQVLPTDLRDSLSTSQLQQWHAIDRESAESGSRVMFVPTFYARGRKNA